STAWLKILSTLLRLGIVRLLPGWDRCCGGLSEPAITLPPPTGEVKRKRGQRSGAKDCREDPMKLSKRNISRSLSRRTIVFTLVGCESMVIWRPRSRFCVASNGLHTDKECAPRRN